VLLLLDVEKGPGCDFLCEVCTGKYNPCDDNSFFTPLSAAAATGQDNVIYHLLFNYISFPEDYSKQDCAEELESYLADALVNAVLGSFKKCILIMHKAGLPLAAIERAVKTHSPTDEKMVRMVAELNDPSLPIQCEEEKGAADGKRGGGGGRGGGSDEDDSDDGSYFSDDDDEDLPPVFWPMPARVLDRWRAGYRRAEMDARPWKEEGNRFFKASNSKLQPLQPPQQRAMVEKALHCYSKGSISSTTSSSVQSSSSPSLARRIRGSGLRVQRG
jgi:hypothetical protein